MNNYISKVKEFMTLFEQPVVDKPTIMSEDRNKLRIALIFEELKEYAEASGLKGYFVYDLCRTTTTEQANSELLEENINQVEQLDALCDLQYVLSGAIIEHGFTNIFDDAFKEVHRSNMSKACNTLDEAYRTLEKLDNEGIKAEFNTEKVPYLIKRCQDGKVLKSINYSPANLKQFINEFNS